MTPHCKELPASQPISTNQNIPVEQIKTNTGAVAGAVESSVMTAPRFVELDFAQGYACAGGDESVLGAKWRKAIEPQWGNSHVVTVLGRYGWNNSMIASQLAKNVTGNSTKSPTLIIADNTITGSHYGSYPSTKIVISEKPDKALIGTPVDRNSASPYRNAGYNYDYNVKTPKKRMISMAAIVSKVTGFIHSRETLMHSHPSDCDPNVAVDTTIVFDDRRLNQEDVADLIMSVASRLEHARVWIIHVI